MSTLTIELDEQAARLVQEAARVANEPVRDWARKSICRAAANAIGGTHSGARVSPLHPGAIQVASDFNAPLEDFSEYE